MKRIKSLFSRIELNDVFIIAGLGLTVAGIWQIYHPAAFIAAGLGFLWLGWPVIRRKR